MTPAAVAGTRSGPLGTSSQHPSTSSQSRPSGAPALTRAELSPAAAAERNLTEDAPALPGEMLGPGAAPMTLQQEKHVISPEWNTQSKRQQGCWVDSEKGLPVKTE